MKNVNLTKCTLFIFTFFTSGLLYAQNEEEMNAWMEASQPVEEHKFLENFAGEWAFESTMWMDPSQPPTKTSGQTTSKMILGNRYLESTHKGGDDQMPFEGRALTAFDKAKKEFISTWVDNMGTGIMIFHGKANDSGSTLEMVADYFNPVTNQNEKHKTVETIIDEGTYKMEYFVQAPGKEEFKAMEIVYTRK